jgi:hypothetical protein
MSGVLHQQPTTVNHNYYHQRNRNEIGGETPSTMAFTMTKRLPNLLSFLCLLLLINLDGIGATHGSDVHRPMYSTRSRPLAFTFSQTELWGIRVASAATTYFGFISFADRPRGQLMVDPKCLEMKQSNVPGAGLGLFVTATLRKDTLIGTYPGVVVPLTQNLDKLRAHPQCEGYIWRFSDNQFVIDPTNTVGDIEDSCRGGNPGMPLSMLYFKSVLSFMQVPTTLCRINEPPKGKDVNVFTDEDRETRTVSFSLERDVYEGEELFIDYGLSYDRSSYGG